MIRAALRSLLARKLRLVLSGLAVVLAVMFIAGSFVLTDTLGRSFDQLFKNAYETVDLQVSAKPLVDVESYGLSPTMPASMVDRVRAVPGTGRATGTVVVNGALVLDRKGKVVPNQTGTSLGANWVGEDEVMKLREGREPRVDTEVVLNAEAAEAGRYHVGDTVPILMPGDEARRHEFTLVGILGFSGGRDSIGGEHLAYFTEATAQRLLLGEPGTFNAIDIDVAPGVTVATLKSNLQTALGESYLVETGDELAKKSAAPLKEIFKFFNYILLGFGGVALLVGIFLILNTFSIIVAQRTRELALLRAMGASKKQLIGSVLAEALLVGLIGSAVGLLIGVGLGALGAWGLGQLAGESFEVAGIAVPGIAVVLSFGIGTTATVLAALLPALKAAKVAPVAAMREAATADRPLTSLTIAGSAVTVGGALVLFFGLRGQGSATLWLVLGGVLAGLVGVALLTPIICRPAVSLLGRVFSWSIPGKLGRRNSARNPRRTAITAAAVMIGIALVTGISTLVSSVTASIETVVDRQLKADLVISGQQTSELSPTISPEDLAEIKTFPEVASTAALTYEFFAKANGRDAFVLAYDDWPTAQRTLELRNKTGDINALGPGQVVLDEQTAKNAKLTVGDQVRIELPKGAKTYTVVGITTRTDIANGYVIPLADAAELFRTAAPMQAYLKLASGASVEATKDKVDAALADSPQVSVQTRDEFVEGVTMIYDFLLNAVQILLLVAITISVLGVINTLVLSVLERTGELGMLRAIGLRRSQTMRMITVESVVISLFGTLLGLVVGVGLGAAVVRALREYGFTKLALPWGYMVAYLIAALIIGVVAAILPAIRAARLNVLNAIAYE